MDVLGDLGFQIDKQAIRQINQTNPQVKQIVTKSTKGESQNSVESEKNMEGQRSDRRTGIFLQILPTFVFKQILFCRTIEFTLFFNF